MAFFLSNGQSLASRMTPANCPLVGGLGSLKSNLRQGWEPALGAIPRYAEEVRLICIGVAATYQTVNCLGNKQCSGQSGTYLESAVYADGAGWLLRKAEVWASPIFSFP